MSTKDFRIYDWTLFKKIGNKKSMFHFLTNILRYNVHIYNYIIHEITFYFFILFN